MAPDLILLSHAYNNHHNGGYAPIVIPLETWRYKGYDQFGR